MKMKNKYLVWMIIFTLMLVLSACGGTTDAGTEDDAANGNDNDTKGSLTTEHSEAVVIEDNYGRTLEFEQVPERAVSLNLHTTEIMLALGLADYIVGIAYANDSVLPQYEDDFNKLTQLADQYPSLEVLLDVEPDFIYARESAFKENGVASVEDLESYGIQVYVDTDSYQPATTIQDVYVDIKNIGRIFHVEDRAEALIDSMKAQIKSVQETVNVEEPVRVLVFDMGGDDVFTAAGDALQTSLIELAGGKNVFDDIEQTWARVNWEEVVERDPQVIIINDYGDTPSEQKINEIMEHPVMQSTSAVQNEHFVVVHLSSVFTSVRNADVVEQMARGFYPHLYE